jgi:hypothetical protein
MSSEETTNFEDQNDQLSHEQNELNQGAERSEDLPSWGEEQEVQNDAPEEQVEETPENEVSNSVEAEVETQEDQGEEQKNTPPDSPRRVLSFEDYFKDGN